MRALRCTRSWLRTQGLQRAKSSAVATLLYTEIVWAFFFDISIMAARPHVLQYGGALVIIGGAVVFALAPAPPPPPGTTEEETRELDERGAPEGGDEFTISR